MSLTATVQAAIVTAFEAIGDLVATVYLTRVQTTSYSADTGDLNRTEFIYEFTGVIDEVERKSAEASADRATGGSSVKLKMATAWLRPGDVEPQPGDNLRIGERKFEVVEANPIMPDGVTILLWQLKVAI